MKKMIAIIALLTSTCSMAAKELPKAIDFVDIKAVNSIGVNYKMCLAVIHHANGETEYQGYEGPRCGEIVRDLQEDPDLKVIPMTVNSKAYVSR